MPRVWTRKELATIKNEIDDIGIRGLERKLGIPASSIRRMVRELNIERNKSLEPTTPFTPEMDRKLKRWYTKHGVSQSVIAERFKLSLQQVNRRVATLGLRKHNIGEFNVVWSQQEINTLVKMYPSYVAEHIAKKLKRPVHSVRKKAEELKLTSDATKLPFIK